MNIQDVVIIGGGPAGSTAAAFLAMCGHKVTVLEKEKMPREHVGESLLPYCYGILKQLGVLDELIKRYVRKPGVRFIDTDGTRHTTWCFGHVLKDPSYLSFHVLRDEFDKLLLDNAGRLGATVREQTKVQSVDLDDELVKVYASGPDGDKQTYRAKFLVDASGRDTFLANRMRLKKPHKELDRVALSTHWIGGKFTGGIEEGLLQIVHLGGDKKGWSWVIPVGANRLSIGVVLNNSYIRREKAKFIEQGIEDWQLALYRQELMYSDFIRNILSEAEIIQPLMVNGDYSYIVEKKYGSNFALIGDAGTFIDPIFASGVFLSMNSARLVATALDEKFTSADNGDVHLNEAYTQINGAYNLVNKAILMFYNSEAINFAQVASAAGLIHQQHANALSIGHYLLAGDFFERHEEYSEFLDLLQDPKLFRRYKKLVIDREDHQTSSCDIDRSQVFGLILEEHKKRRAERAKKTQASMAEEERRLI